MPSGLLTLAERDYQAALVLAHAETPLMDAALFHLQQAAEKSLKAWLALKRVDYPRTHDLNPLLGLLEDQDENVGPFWSLLTLNPFAVQFRYDVAGEETADFEGSAQLTAQLLARVRQIIG